MVISQAEQFQLNERMVIPRDTTEVSAHAPRLEKKQKARKEEQQEAKKKNSEETTTRTTFTFKRPGENMQPKNYITTFSLH